MQNNNIPHSDCSTGNIEYIDFLRAFAALAVLFFHSSATLPYECIPRQLISTGLNWCVPMFVLVTGALFLGHKQDCSLQNICRKHLKKILIILVVWGFVYNFLCTVIIDRSISFSTVATSLSMILQADTRYCYQFWYLYLLVGLYILIPLLKPWTDRHISNSFISKDGCWMLIIFFALSIVLPTISKGFGWDSFFWKGAFIPFTPYLLYLLLGKVLYCKRLSHHFRKGLLYLFLLQGVILTVEIFLGRGQATEKWTGYGSIFTCTMSMLLFDTLSHISLEKLPTAIRKLIRKVSDASLGIYIFHVMILQLLRKIGLTPDLLGPWLFVAVTGCITFIICYFATIICKRLPILKKLV